MSPEIGVRFLPMGGWARFVAIPFSLLSFEGLSPTCKLLWGLLALKLGRNGGAYPTRAYLAKHMGITKRSVSRAARQLADAGFLEMEPGIGRTPTRYHLLYHEIFQKDPYVQLDKMVFFAGVDANVPSPKSRVDIPVHSKRSERGRGLPPRVDADVNQKITSSKKQKEEKNTAATSLAPDLKEWCNLHLALDVYEKNLSREEAEDRNVELHSVVQAGAPVDLTLDALRDEIGKVEQAIAVLSSAGVKEHCMRHLREGSLRKKDLERFQEGLGQASAR